MQLPETVLSQNTVGLDHVKFAAAPVHEDHLVNAVGKELAKEDHNRVIAKELDDAEDLQIAAFREEQKEEKN